MIEEEGCIEEEGRHPGDENKPSLGDNKIIKETIEYIEKTGRFKLDQWIIQEAIYRRYLNKEEGNLNISIH